MDTDTIIPTGDDVEHAAAILRSEAAQLARYNEPTPDWPDGYWSGPLSPESEPAPGAVEEARRILRVAIVLEQLREPLDKFAEMQAAGLSPMDFLMGFMGGDPDLEHPSSPLELPE